MKPRVKTFLLRFTEGFLGPAALEEAREDGDDLVVGDVAQQDDREDFLQSVKNDSGNVFC